jgi:uncharacterized protein
VNYFCLDASALGKRYIPELGTPLLNTLFEDVPHERLMCWDVGTAEVVSIFVRQRNDGRITQTHFDQALTDFRSEVIEPDTFRILETTMTLILNALDLISTHSINGNDAIFLQASINVADELRADGNALVIVASDARLIRAAQAENLSTFNPEQETEADLERFIQAD